LNCPTGQTSNGVGCTSCATGSGFEQNTANSTLTGCNICTVSNCATCIADYMNCDSCGTGYLIAVNTDTDNNVCLSTTVLNCAANSTDTDFGCTNCTVGYGLTANVNITNFSGCLACNVSNCGMCYSNFALCQDQGCNAGYFLPLISNTTAGSELNNNVCQSSTPLNCNTTTDGVGCATCSLGTGLTFNVLNTTYTSCNNCSIGNCQDCHNSSASCVVCSANYVNYFLNSSANIAGCASCSALSCPSANTSCSAYEGCANCNSGAFATPSNTITGLTQCSTCATGCTACTGLTSCSVCSNNYKLTTSNSNGTNVSVCAANASGKLAFGLVSMVFAVFYLLF